MDRRERHTVVPRDQGRSAFSQILQNLLEATPGALGAALVDGTGEAVDYAGPLEPFDIKVAAAHMQLELRKASVALIAWSGPIRELVVRATGRAYAVRALPDGYYLIVVLGRCAGFGISPRAISQAEFDLRAEAGWRPPRGAERWVHARVEPSSEDRRRPKRVHLWGEWFDVEVIGTIMGLKRGERGYRVRTPRGAELTLVRERLGRWYADARFASSVVAD